VPFRGAPGILPQFDAAGRSCHFGVGMSVTIQLELPEALMQEAKANGLLEPERLGDLLAAELRRRKAGGALDAVLDGIRGQPGVPMTPEEIQVEKEAARADRRAREARH
jgi:hypothetical protein